MPMQHRSSEHSLLVRSSREPPRMATAQLVRMLTPVDDL
jgi:hypothetical protein